MRMNTNNFQFCGEPSLVFFRERRASREHIYTQSHRHTPSGRYAARPRDALTYSQQHDTNSSHTKNRPPRRPPAENAPFAATRPPPSTPHDLTTRTGPRPSEQPCRTTRASRSTCTSPARAGVRRGKAFAGRSGPEPLGFVAPSSARAEGTPGEATVLQASAPGRTG